MIYGTLDYMLQYMQENNVDGTLESYVEGKWRKVGSVQILSGDKAVIYHLEEIGSREVVMSKTTVRLSKIVTYPEPI